MFDLKLGKPHPPARDMRFCPNEQTLISLQMKKLHFSSHSKSLVMHAASAFVASNGREQVARVPVGICFNFGCFS